MPNFKFKPTLVSEDETVTLRPFQEQDVERMLEIISLPEVNLYTGALDHTPTKSERFPVAEEDKARTISWYQTRNEQSDRLDLAIVYQDILVGEVVLNLYDKTTNSANLRLLIADDATGSGIGQQVFDLILPYAFLALGLDALTLDAFEFNPRAIHVYHKMGFKDTEVVDDELVLDGKSMSAINMELTKDDFLDQQNNVID